MAQLFVGGPPDLRISIFDWSFQNLKALDASRACKLTSYRMTPAGCDSATITVSAISEQMERLYPWWLGRNGVEISTGDDVTQAPINFTTSTFTVAERVAGVVARIYVGNRKAYRVATDSDYNGEDAPQIYLMDGSTLTMRMKVFSTGTDGTGDYIGVLAPIAGGGNPTTIPNYATGTLIGRRIYCGRIARREKQMTNLPGVVISCVGMQSSLDAINGTWTISPSNDYSTRMDVGLAMFNVLNSSTARLPDLTVAASNFPTVGSGYAGTRQTSPMTAMIQDIIGAIATGDLWVLRIGHDRVARLVRAFVSSTNAYPYGVTFDSRSLYWVPRGMQVVDQDMTALANSVEVLGDIDPQTKNPVAAIATDSVSITNWGQVDASPASNTAMKTQADAIAAAGAIIKRNSAPITSVQFGFHTRNLPNAKAAQYSPIGLPYGNPLNGLQGITIKGLNETGSVRNLVADSELAIATGPNSLWTFVGGASLAVGAGPGGANAISMPAVNANAYAYSQPINVRPGDWITLGGYVAAPGVTGGLLWWTLYAPDLSVRIGAAAATLGASARVTPQAIQIPSNYAFDTVVVLMQAASTTGSGTIIAAQPQAERGTTGTAYVANDASANLIGLPTYIEETLTAGRGRACTVEFAAVQPDFNAEMARLLNQALAVTRANAAKPAFIDGYCVSPGAYNANAVPFAVTPGPPITCTPSSFYARFAPGTPVQLMTPGAFVVLPNTVTRVWLLSSNTWATYSDFTQPANGILYSIVQTNATTVIGATRQASIGVALIDQAQLTAMPAGQAAPTLSGVSAITYPVVTGSAGNATYDAQATFTVDITTAATSPWYVGIQLFDVPAGFSGNITLYPNGPVLPYGLATSGTYVGIWARIGAGNARDLYCAYVDGQGKYSPVSAKIGTTAANPAGSSAFAGVLGTTPVEASAATGLTYFNVGLATIDAEATIHLDSNGTTSNNALAELEAVMAPHARALGSNSDGWVSAGAPRAKNASGNYVITWGGLGAGTTMDLGVRYVGHDGQRSNVLVLTELGATAAQPIVIGPGSLPTAAAPVITLSGTPTLSAYKLGPSNFGVKLAFTAAISPDPQTFVSRAEIHATQVGTWNSVGCPGIVVGTIPKVSLAAAATPYTVVLNGLPTGMIGGYDLHIVLYDFQGIAKDGGAPNIITVPQQTFNAAALPKMPAGATFTATGVSTSVVNGNSALVGKYVPGANLIALFTFNCTTTPTVDTWVYQFVPYYRVTGTATWYKGKPETILGAIDGSAMSISIGGIPGGVSLDVAGVITDGQGNATAQVTIATSVNVPSADDGGNNSWLGPVLGPTKLKGSGGDSGGWPVNAPITQQYIGGDGVYDQQPTQSPSGTDVIQNSSFASLKGANDPALTAVFSRWVVTRNDLGWTFFDNTTVPDYIGCAMPSGAVVPASSTKSLTIANGSAGAPYTFRCIPGESWNLTATAYFAWSSYPASITVSEYLQVNWYGPSGYLSTTAGPALSNQGAGDLSLSATCVAPAGAQYGHFILVVSVANSSGSPITLTVSPMYNYLKAGASCKKMPNYDTETYVPPSPINQKVLTSHYTPSTGILAGAFNAGAVHTGDIQDGAATSTKIGLGAVTPERMVGGTGGDVGTIFNGNTIKYDRNDTSITSTITQTPGADNKYLATGAVSDRVIEQAQVSPWHFKGGFGAITDNVSTDTIALGSSYAPNSVNTGGVNQIDNGDFSIPAAPNESGAPANCWKFTTTALGLTWTAAREAAGALSVPGPDILIGIPGSGQSVNANAYSIAQTVSNPSKKCKPGDQFNLSANLAFVVNGTLPGGVVAGGQIIADWYDVNAAYLSSTAVFTNTTAPSELSTPVQFTAPASARSYAFYVRAFVSNSNGTATAMQAGTYPVYVRASNIVLRKTVNTDTLVDGAVVDPKIAPSQLKLKHFYGGDGVTTTALVDGSNRVLYGLHAPPYQAVIDSVAGGDTLYMKPGQVNTRHVNDDQITAAKVPVGAIGAGHILGVPGSPTKATALSQDYVKDGATFSRLTASTYGELIDNGDFSIAPAPGDTGIAARWSAMSVSGGAWQSGREAAAGSVYFGTVIPDIYAYFNNGSTQSIPATTQWQAQFFPTNSTGANLPTACRPGDQLTVRFKERMDLGAALPGGVYVGFAVFVYYYDNSGYYLSGSSVAGTTYTSGSTTVDGSAGTAVTVPTGAVSALIGLVAYINNPTAGAYVAPAGLFAVRWAQISMKRTNATADVSDNAITGPKIPALGITTAHLNDLAVVTGKLADTAVSTAKIAALAVTDAKAVFKQTTTFKQSGSPVPNRMPSFTIYGYHTGTSPNATLYFSNDSTFTATAQNYTGKALDGTAISPAAFLVNESFSPYSSALYYFIIIAYDWATNTLVKVYSGIGGAGSADDIWNSFKDGRLPILSNLTFQASGTSIATASPQTAQLSFGGRSGTFY